MQVCVVLSSDDVRSVHLFYDMNQVYFSRSWCQFALWQKKLYKYSASICDKSALWL